MNKSESIKELAGALSKAQGEFGFAKMNATNPFLKNKYADLGEVIQAVKPAMAKNGLSFTQMATSTDGKVGIETVIMHASGEWMSSMVELPVEGDKALSSAQSMGKVITYLRRYALASALGIYSDQDTDGDHGDGKKPEAPKSQPSQKSQSKSEPGTNGLTFMSALQIKTAKGTPLNTLTDERMTVLQLKGEGEAQKTAGYLLGVAVPEDYDNYFSLLTVAEDKKISVPPLPEKVTRIQLWREMQKLIELTK